MPKVKSRKEGRGKYILHADDPLKTGKPETKIRVYKPEGTVDKIYKDPNRMMQWRERYKKMGIRTRKI